MTNRQLVELVASSAGVSQSTARSVLAALSEHTTAALAAGQNVSISGLGVLETRWVSERTLRSIHSGRKMAVEGHYRAAFRAGGPLRVALRSRTPQLLKDPAHQTAWRLAETLVSDLDLYHGANAPREAAPDADTDTIHAVCAASFGNAWARARLTFEEHTPSAVRSARDHLALAARRRWLSPP